MQWEFIKRLSCVDGAWENTCGPQRVVNASQASIKFNAISVTTSLAGNIVVINYAHCYDAHRCFTLIALTYQVWADLCRSEQAVILTESVWKMITSGTRIRISHPPYSSLSYLKVRAGIPNYKSGKLSCLHLKNIPNTE